MTEKINFEKDVFKRALRRLTTPLEPEEQPATSLFEHDQLINACQIVGADADIRFKSSNEVELEGLSTLEAVEMLTRSSEVAFRQVSLESGWHRRPSEPFLGFIKETGKPVALVIQSGKYCIEDPETGSRRAVGKKEAKKLMPYGFVFYQLIPRRLTAYKLFKTISSGEIPSILKVVCVSLLVSLLSLFFPFANKILFDRILPQLDLGMYAQLFTALFCAILIVAGLTYYKAVQVLRLKGMFSVRFQAVLWGQLLRLSPQFFRIYTVGDLLQRLAIIEGIQQTLNRNAVNTILYGITSVVFFLAMLLFSWQLSLIVLVVVVIMFLVSAGFFPKIIKANLRILRLASKISAGLLQMVSGIGELRVYRAAKRGFSYWADLFTAQQQINYDLSLLNNGLKTAYQTVTGILTILIYVAMLYFMLDEEGNYLLSIGSFIAFQTTMNQFITSFFGLGTILFDSLGIVAYWHRIAPIWEGRERLKSGKNMPALSGEVHIDQVSFSYPGQKKEVVSKFTAHIRPGEMVLITGSSGSGKSTLLRLMGGMEKPNSGELLFDRYGIEDIDRCSFKKQVGGILQSSRVFAGTIRENILCGRSVDLTKLDQALERAHLQPVLDALPMGLNTLLPSGEQLLSHGQRMRVLLARALYDDPKVLLLDEVLASLDEKVVKKLIKELKEHGKTVFLVTHQLELLSHADQHFDMDRLH